MSHTPVPDYVDRLLRAGAVFTGLIEDLLEALEGTDPWPGEEPAAVLFEMLAGSVAKAFEGVPDGEVEQAARLLDRAVAGVLDDLRGAELLSRASAAA